MAISANGYAVENGKLGTPISYGTLRRQRIQFDSTGFSDGKIFIVGGKEIPTSEADGQQNSEGLGVSRTAEYYLPEKKKWFETPPLPHPIENARSFGLSESEVLVVDLDQGNGIIWSFTSNSWKPGFNLGKRIGRAIMHTQGRLMATVSEAGSEQILLWNPVKKTQELIKSQLPFDAGAGLIELDDQRVLETQSGGVLIWDLKKKSAVRLNK